MFSPKKPVDWMVCDIVEQPEMLGFPHNGLAGNGVGTRFST